MYVILLEEVKKLGQLGDKVKVKAGFARNYLIPYQLAVPATEANIMNFEARRASLQQLAEEKRQAAQARADQLIELAQVTITARASDDGHLFGSIRDQQVAQAITEAGVVVKKNEVLLSNGAVRELGEYDVVIQLHHEVFQSIRLVVVAE